MCMFLTYFTKSKFLVKIRLIFFFSVSREMGHLNLCYKYLYVLLNTYNLEINRKPLYIFPDT